MKKLILFVSLIGSLSLLSAGNVEFYLDLCRFQNAESEPYIEVYMSIDGTSVDYKEVKKSQFQASVNILMYLRRIEGEDSLIVYRDNYNLLSQYLKDTVASRRQAFVEMKRIQLTPGDYLLQVIMKDNHDADAYGVANLSTFEVPAPAPDVFAFSDLEFVNSIRKSERENVLSKNGYEIVPFGMNATFVDQDKLSFYLEMYHANQVFDEPYFAQASILQGKRPLLMYDLTRQKNPQPMDAFSGSFDISRLPSQTYQLQIKLFNRNFPEGKVYNQSFYVSNSRVIPQLEEYVNTNSDAEFFSQYSEEQLTYFIKTLLHISTENEIRFAKALDKYEDKKSYLYSFWEKRLSPGKTVAQLWQGYNSALEYVNDDFESNFREGWETDRGRVFLKYGIPSDVELYPRDGSTLPHQVWKYDRLGAQTQVIFVFIDTDLATDEYPLIHSNKYGEVQNYGWKSMLINGDTADPSLQYERDTYDAPSRSNRSIDP
jgi:GWxTD domain-containing protein